MLFDLSNEDCSWIGFVEVADFGTQSFILGFGKEVEVTEVST